MSPQAAVSRAEELLKVHQEYQRGLRAFQDWLDQQQEALGCYTQLEGDVDTLEDTLHKLQVCRRLQEETSAPAADSCRL